jgi:hypothetical protein
MKKRSICLGIVLCGLLVELALAQAPVPFVHMPLVPDTATPGSVQTTVTLNGVGFTTNSVVKWNGVALATQYVSGTRLTATIPASDLATAGTGWVTVVNPAPGGGPSNLMFFTVTPKVASVGFVLASSPAVGGSPRAMAVADFNNDGKLDVVTGNYLGGDASVLLGDGTGHFTLASSPTGGYWYVATGDFNHDGNQDLVNTQYLGNTISVMLGDGTGNFTLASQPTVGDMPSAVAVADFNGDGNLDLAVVNLGGYFVSIMLGDGTGNFTLASSPAVGIWPEAVATGDFNGDGKLDLAVVNNYSSTVSILMGDGTGNFTAGPSLTAGAAPGASSIAAADFNGDGILDLAVGNIQGEDAMIYLGDGTGNFSLSSTLTPGTLPSGVAPADFNGDGLVDLVVSNEGTCTATCLSMASVMLGDGTGAFTTATLPAINNAVPFGVAAGDFNGDGMMDFVTVNEESSTVSVLLQVVPFAAVSLSSTKLTYGTQRIGTSSSTQHVTITNTGTEIITVSSITISPNFTYTTHCGTIQLGATCNIVVTFSPQSVGNITGTITVTDNATGSPQTISLSGVGTEVSLTPSSLSFGNQKVGKKSAAKTVTLKNYGTTALSVTSIKFTGSNPGNFAQTNTCGGSVSAGGTCSISVTFTPNQKGSRTATLSVTDNGGASPQTVAVSGTGD